MTNRMSLEVSRFSQGGNGGNANGIHPCQNHSVLFRQLYSTRHPSIVMPHLPGIYGLSRIETAFLIFYFRATGALTKIYLAPKSSQNRGLGLNVTFATCCIKLEKGMGIDCLGSRFHEKNRNVLKLRHDKSAHHIRTVGSKVRDCNPGSSHS